MVDRDGYAIEPARVEGVRAFPVPYTRKQLQRFLGVANQVRGFIYNLAPMAAPLYGLQNGGDGRLRGCDAAGDTAFEAVKEAAIEAAVPLRHTHDGADLVLSTDASSIGVGRVLRAGRPQWRALAGGVRQQAVQRGPAQLDDGRARRVCGEVGAAAVAPHVGRPPLHDRDRPPQPPVRRPQRVAQGDACGGGDQQRRPVSVASPATPREYARPPS